MYTKIETSKHIRIDDTSFPFVIKNADKMREIANIPHRHSYFSILWSFNTAGKHIIDGKEYLLEPHHIFFIAPGQVHQIILPNPKGLLILFTPEFLLSNSPRQQFLTNMGLFDRHNSGPLTLSTHLVKKLMIHANGMMDAFHSSHKLKFETIEAHLKLFLIECDTQYIQAKKNTAGEDTVINPMVKSFISLVESRFYEWRQVQDYANKLNVTPKYLGEIVKQALSQSPKEYIQDRIILETKRMLLFTNRSLKEIGFELGFEDPARFSRFFKDCTGISFQEFNKSGT